VVAAGGSRSSWCWQVPRYRYLAMSNQSLRLTSLHLTSSLSTSTNSPAGSSQLHLALHPGREESYLRSLDRTPAADRPNTPPHMSHPRPSLHSLRCASTCSPVPRLANSRSAGPSLQTGTWLATHNPTLVVILLDPLTCKADVLLQRHTATQSGFRHKSPHFVVQPPSTPNGLMRDDSMIHGHRATSQQHVVTCNAAL
jgi:hypothetical protein